MSEDTENKPFYITTPIYYVNGLPHIGHAYTTVAADVLARFKKLQGREVFFSTGTDEHGQKIAKKAEEVGKDPAPFVDEMAEEFQKLWKRLDIDYTKFIRTTEPAHKKAVQQVLQDFYDRGIIYQGFYEGLYCIGCEQFKTADDLVDGKCPDHNREPEFMKEESYLMKMTVMQQELLRRIESDELRVMPEKYKTEILSFLKGEVLEDISISRKNVKWGIPLPFDESHTTYVWVDAFLNYLTVLGWEGDKDIAPKEWPADVQFIGKDILRVHATIWPVILMHLGLPTQKTLLTHGHILSGGKKMSKTLGNVIAIDDMLERFGTDGTRYLLMSAGTFGEDVDLTMERMIDKYNADLANGLGNLVSRVVKLSEKLEPGFYDRLDLKFGKDHRKYPTIGFYNAMLENFQFSETLNHLWNLLVLDNTSNSIDALSVKKANQRIDVEKPWELVKNDPKKFEEVMMELLQDVALLGDLLRPFLPSTSDKIATALKTGKVEPLFQRIV